MEEDSKCDIVQQLLCMACLGAGDTLHTLTDGARQLYRDAANNGRQLVHNISPRVCWQCEILHKKVVRFRERVTECHDVLNNSVTCDVTRPPRLQPHGTAVVDIPPLVAECEKLQDKDKETDVGIKQDIDVGVIKRETLVDMDIKVEASELESPCPTCLCAGRSLHNIGDKERIYYSEILKRHGCAVTSPRLCWECGWRLRVAARFSEQSAESYRMLLPSLQSADIQDITTLLCSGVSLPPRLRRCVRPCVDIPPTRDEPAAELTQVTTRDSTHLAAEKLYQCSQCSKTFNNKRNLKRHTMIHTGEKPYQCSQCSKRFYTTGNLKQHIRSHTGEKPHQCIQCTDRFSHKNHLKRHMMIHTGEKPYQCSHCSKRFTDRTYLKQHIRSHTGEKPHQCIHCTDRFSHKSHLKRHMITHTGEKPYQCSHCSKRFPDRTYLIQHIRTHTGEKPHQCIQCTDRFSHKSHLKRHVMIMHTGEKLYQCSQCSKIFATRYFLNKHLISHTGAQTPYQCSQCSQNFSTKYFLNKHLITHTGAQPPYQCSQCSKRFSNKSIFLRHIRSH